MTLQDIGLTFGGAPLLAGADLVVRAGDRVCLVGRNGSGKSTFLRIAAGEIEPDTGERFVDTGASVRYLPQEPDLAGYASVLDYVEDGLAPGDDRHRGRYLLEQLGLDPGADTATLSGGEARRVALARALAPEPDILLLDEPTNHLDLPAIAWLESEVGGMKSAVVMVSHDRRFLETLSRTTVWLDRGTVRRMDKGFADFESWRDDVLAAEELERHKLDRKIAMEEDWLRYGVTARRKRNMRRLGELQALREKRRASLRSGGNVALRAEAGEVSGKRVIEARGLHKAFGDRVIVRDLDLRVVRGDRLAIIGPNGCGKTTLVKLITAAIEPDAGTLTLGSNLDMASLEQDRSSLDADMALKDALADGGSDQVMVNAKPRHVMSWMQDFLFRPEQARTPLKALSGGERARVMLARALARPSNLMVLDEPTNDLDLETLDLLQDLLADYPGTLVLVSHDRDFIDRIATSTLVFEGGGRWREYPGGYSDVVAQGGGARTGVAAKPKTRGGGSAQKSGAAAGVPRRRTKLSYKQKYALESLPERIEKLQGRVAELEAELADSSLYTRDPERFSGLSLALESRRSELAQAEDEWLELEVLREELEG